MQPNTHDQKQINLTTTPTPAQAAKPQYDRILLGIDKLRIVRQLDGAGRQPPPCGLTLAGQAVKDIEYSAAERRLRIRFQHQARPRELIVQSLTR